MRPSSSRFPSTDRTFGSGAGVGEVAGDAIAVGDGEGDGVCAIVTFALSEKNNAAAKTSRRAPLLVLHASLIQFTPKVRAAYPNRLGVSIIFELNKGLPKDC